jgi:hypothetical protein
MCKEPEETEETEETEEAERGRKENKREFLKILIIVVARKLKKSFKERRDDSAGLSDMLAPPKQQLTGVFLLPPFLPSILLSCPPSILLSRPPSFTLFCSVSPSDLSDHYIICADLDASVQQLVDFLGLKEHIVLLSNLPEDKLDISWARAKKYKNIYYGMPLRSLSFLTSLHCSLSNFFSFRRYDHPQGFEKCWCPPGQKSHHHAFLSY